MTTKDTQLSRRGLLRAAGASAALAAGGAGATGSAAAQEGGGTETVELVDYAFKGATESPLYIKPGTTVKFVWKTDGHNINVDQKPDGSDWSGVQSLHDSGYSDSHTFTTKGKYHFWCDPHKSLGMVGDIVVTDNPPKQGEGGYQSILPDGAKLVGIAGTVVMSLVLGFSYVAMRYGGDYGADADFERGRDENQ